jgi:hypothetical protein
VTVRQLRIGLGHIFEADGAIQGFHIFGMDSNFIDVHFNIMPCKSKLFHGDLSILLSHSLDRGSEFFVLDFLKSDSYSGLVEGTQPLVWGKGARQESRSQGLDEADLRGR